MKSENNLTQLEKQLQTAHTTKLANKIEIQKSLAFAMQRCDSLDLNALLCSDDIFDQFNSKLSLGCIKIAIRNGSMGKYGINYKLTTQVISNWIYKYINE